MHLLKLPEYGNTSAVSTDHKSFRFTFRLWKFNAPKQRIKKAVVDFIKLPDHIFLENFLRFSKMGNGISLYTDDLIRNLLCKVNYGNEKFHRYLTHFAIRDLRLVMLILISPYIQIRFSFRLFFSMFFPDNSLIDFQAFIIDGFFSFSDIQTAPFDLFSIKNRFFP